MKDPDTMFFDVLSKYIAKTKKLDVNLDTWEQDDLEEACMALEVVLNEKAMAEDGETDGI